MELSGKRIWPSFMLSVAHLKHASSKHRHVPKTELKRERRVGQRCRFKETQTRNIKGDEH